MFVENRGEVLLPVLTAYNYLVYAIILLNLVFTSVENIFLPLPKEYLEGDKFRMIRIKGTFEGSLVMMKEEFNPEKGVSDNVNVKGAFNIVCGHESFID